MGALLALCYSYQFVFLVISYCRRPKPLPEAPVSKIAVLVAARNEEGVIAELLSAIKEQSYPQHLMEVFVTADNCTDGTAALARSLGATVYERRDTDRVGKGYVLDYMLKRIREERGVDAFDSYIVFDADNIPHKDFIKEELKVIAAGYDCAVGYRASKNYDDSWLSAGQGMCFLRDMVLLNRARMVTGSCCFVSGTGFMFTRALLERIGGGWPFHTLTEDGEFTVWAAINGVKIGYADNAIFYDEQPKRHSQSWNQRLRWCRGGVQIFSSYFKDLVKGIFSGGALACFDMAMCMAPAYLISVVTLATNVLGLIVTAAVGGDLLFNLTLVAIGIAGIYAMLLIFSLSLTISEWRLIRGRWYKKIFYAFTFPLYMMTFVPIAVVALFKKNVKWKQIDHTPKS